jgi:phenylpropionate dioxygenase-like ring-hydroxylating dioxygenase large terminal subunit
MFVRRCWYVAAWGYELKQGELVARTIINEPVVLYRAQDGAVVAMEDRCCHRFAPLSVGRLEGDDLRCMYHGLKYDRRGACIEIPGQPLVPPKMRVRVFPAVEKHGWIWLWMGEAALADPALIPPAVGSEDPNWTLRTGQMDYEANYELINDNLTDFTHLSYVHPSSFGATEEFARTRPNVTRIPRGIRVQRWLSNALNADSGSALDKMRGALTDTDMWQTYDYLAPGILLMHTASYPRGTADRIGRREPRPEDGVPVSETFTSQAVTPMTATTSRYYFSWGPRSGEGSDALADIMMGVALTAFAEDKSIIEKQQKIIHFDPNRREQLISADLGPTQMRRVIEELIRADGDPSPQRAAGAE